MRILHFFLTTLILALFSISLLKAQDSTSIAQEADSFVVKSDAFFPVQLDSAIYYREKALPLYQQINNWDGFVNCRNSFSNFYYLKGEYDAFEENAIASLNLAQEHQVKNEVYANALNNISFLYKLKGDYGQAIQYYLQSIELIKDNSPDLNYFIPYYHNITSAFREKGDYNEAIRFSEQALSLLDSPEGQNLKTLRAKTHLNLGYIYRVKKSFEKSLFHYYTCIALLDDKEKDNTIDLRNRIYAYQSIAKIHLAQNQLDSAQLYVQQAIAANSETDYRRKILSYEIQGELFLQQQNNKEAIAAYEQANAMAFLAFNRFEQHQAKARTFKGLANAYLAMGDQKQALAYFQKALWTNSFNFSDTTGLSNPLVDQFFSQPEGLEILNGKAQALFQSFEQSGQVEDLIAANDNYQWASQLIRLMRQSYLAEGSKLTLSEKSLQVYEGGIKTALLLYQHSKEDQYLAKAFQLAEQNKARLLLESLQNEVAKAGGNIPEEQLTKEDNLRREIAFYENQINREKQKKTKANEAKLTNWANKLFDLRQQFNTLIQQFEQQYPQYFDLKYNDAPLDWRQLVQDSETILLEYFVGEENIYVFKVSQDQLEAFTLPKPDHFYTSIANLRNLLSLPPNSETFQNQFQEFTQQSQQLYQAILAPVLKETSTSSKSTLRIIPDDQLAFLPFELLLTQAPSSDSPDYHPRNLAYLLNDYTISYDYSASLVLQNAQFKSNMQLKKFLGFAPSFAPAMELASRSCSDGEVYALRCNQTEVESIQQLLKGEVVIASEASKANFMQQAANYRILHLATHACVDEENPALSKIYFTDDYLTQQELRSLSIGAELTVLSACNTGSGKLLRGEGVMSWSRGFMLAGCPSTLMSLWSVDDCTTSTIMEAYYQGLSAGLAKDQALRQAKQDYLDTTTDKAAAHPYYWAAFIQSGNPAALAFSAWYQSWWLWGLGTFFLLFLVWKRRN